MNPKLLVEGPDPVATVPNEANLAPDLAVVLDPNPPNPPAAGAGAGLTAVSTFTPNPLAPKDATFVSPKPPKRVPTLALPNGVLAFSRVGVGGTGVGEATLLAAGTAKRRLMTGLFTSALLVSSFSSTNLCSSSGSNPFRPPFSFPSASDGAEMEGRSVESWAGICDCVAGGEEGRAEGGGWFAGGGGCVCGEAAWGPAACVKTLRRGKTGCDCDCVAGHGARGERRRVPNGGVGILGGVTDRLGVAVEAEACGVEVRGKLSVLAFFDGARLLQRPFLGGRDGADSAGSISIVMGGDVGMRGFTVTIGGVEAV